MKRIFNWYNDRSKQVRDSIVISATVVGMLSTFMSILGISLGDWKGSSVWVRISVVFVFYLVICMIIYFVIGKIFKESVNLNIRHTPIYITYGDIFEASGWKVIGCDTHFDTRVDDIVISKKSLQGQLVIEHGNKEEIERTGSRVWFSFIAGGS